MNATTTQVPPRTGVRTELARYTVEGQERILYGQRVLGVVRITDVPAGAGDRAYLIERGLEQDGHAALQALIEDYLQLAARHNQIPMALDLLEIYTGA